MRKFIILFFLITTILGAVPQTKSNLTQQNSENPIVGQDWKYHKVGTLWSRVTNLGKTGDDAYLNKTPSCDWPGGSGNSYLYRGSLWLSAFVDGVVHSTQPEDYEYAPIDSVHYYTDDPRAPSATYTKYYDVLAPLASGHFPLGLEVTERTYAWPENYRDDFIIYEYVIKNVGIDQNGDGYPEIENGYNLENFYFTYRLDGDVSKLPDWDADYRFSNQDDHTGVNSSWGLLELFPEWNKAISDMGLTTEEALGSPDSTLMFMWDGDNPQYPAWDEFGAPDNDAFNPGINGRFQTPGFLGFRILKTQPASFKPSSFHTNHIYNDPSTDQESYDRMMLPKEFESEGPSGVLINPSSRKPFPNDYRGVMSLGPIELLAPGDSVIVTAALGVGCDTDSAGIYSLMELVKIMDIAKLLVESTFYPVGIIQNNNSQVSEFQLFSNYPNPFNPSTKIRFQIPRSTMVDISVHNIIGEKVRSIICDKISAGYHEYSWDGTDQTGNFTSTGIYFVKVNTIDFGTKANKVLLVQ